MIPQYHIKPVSWATHEMQLRQIREQVFIVEQCVPADIEWDTYDADAMHLLVENNQQQVIGCARILKTGYIGRMGLLKEWRGVGIGLALLTQAIEICKQNKTNKVSLSAQTHVIKFYEKAGFVVVSEPYIDANIWHVDMQLTN